MASRLTASLSSKYAPASSRVGSPKLFATAGRPLQKEKSESHDPEDVKQLADAVKLINKQDPETMEKVTEAAEAVKEGAKEVRKTSEFIRDTTKAAADSVTQMSKTMTEKVIDVAENATGAPKGTVNIAARAAKKIKEAIVGKE